MEYQKFAKYYDAFYQNKDYEKEVNFLLKIIPNNSYIMDIGIGTGTHASYLEKKGFNIDGLDINKEMLDIAKTKIRSKLYCQNMLDINIDSKYDVIISMFAVINHLKSLNELEKCLLNFKDILKKDGLIIIDLHNPSTSGQKTDKYDNMTRIMKWDYDRINQKEISTITYLIDNIKYEDKHIFTIFTIEDIINVCKRINLKLINIYENYDISKKGNNLSKNLQFIIKYM